MQKSPIKPNYQNDDNVESNNSYSHQQAETNYTNPRRLLSHPHYIQKICKYINVRGDFAKAALLSHVNQGWDETLWNYQTLHTTFWNNIFRPSPAQIFQDCHSLLKLHFQKEVDEMNEDKEEQQEEAEAGNDSDDYDENQYDNNDDDDYDYDETSSDECDCGRCHNCLQRRFVELCAEFNEASRTEHSFLVRKLERLIDDCPLDSLFVFLPPEFLSLPIFAQKRALIVLKRIVPDNGFSTRVDFALLNRQRLLIEGFLPYHEIFAEFFHKSTEFFSHAPLFSNTAEGAKSFVNSLIVSLLRESFINETHNHASKKSDWFNPFRLKDDEAERKLRASLSASPPYFVFLKLGEAFFEKNEATSLKWNPIMEAVRTDNVEAFEAFVQAAATVALRREKKKKFEEAKRNSSNEKSSDEEQSDDNDNNNNDNNDNNDGNDDDSQQHQLLQLDQSKIDEMKCSIVNDLELESSHFSFIRCDWADLVHERTRHCVLLPDNSQFTATRVALICGSLNIFQHLTSGPYKTATALETIRPCGTSPHWLFVGNPSWSPRQPSLPICQTVTDLVHLGSIASVTGYDSAKRSLDFSQKETSIPFTSHSRRENRKQIFRIILKEMLERCLVVVDSNGVKKILPSLESFASSREWKFSHKKTDSADFSSKVKASATPIEPSCTMTIYLVLTLRCCLLYSSLCSESTLKSLVVDIFDVVHDFGGEDLVRKLLFEGAILPFVPGLDETLFRQFCAKAVEPNQNNLVTIIDDQSPIVLHINFYCYVLVDFMNTHAFHECGNITSSSSSSPTFFSLLYKYLQEDPSFILANLDRHSAKLSPLWCLCKSFQTVGSPFAVKTFEFLVKKTNANNVFSCKNVLPHLHVIANHEDRFNLLHQLVDFNSLIADQSSRNANSFHSNGFQQAFLDENRLKLVRAMLKFVSVEHGYDKLHQFLNQRSEMGQFTPLHRCVLVNDFKGAMILVREFGADPLAADAEGVVKGFMTGPVQATASNHRIFQHILDPKCDLSFTEIEQQVAERIYKK